MLNFEISKKLKDAGFPQEPKIDISGIDGEFFGGFYYIIKTEIQELAPNFLDQREYEQYLQSASDPISPTNNPPDLIKIPSLEELIQSIHEFDFGFVNGRNFNLSGSWMHDFGYKASIYIIRNIESGEEEHFGEWS